MATTIWKGHLTFGLVSIPVKLYRAARAEKVSFRHLHRTWTPAAKPELPARPLAAVKEPERRAALEAPAKNRPAGVAPVPMPAVETVSKVQQRVVAEADETPVERSHLVKGYEYEKDKYVVIEKDELRALTPETDRNMQITEFVKLADIDPVYFESSFYVAPEKAGLKPYALLYEALRQSGYVALAQFAMHRREHVVVLRPGARGILLHTMFYNSEIRSEDEFAVDKSLVVDRELEMGKQLIQAMAAEFKPEKFRDTYKEQLDALIQAKVEGKEVAQSRNPKPKPVTDIMKALQSSLEIARKPATSAGSTKAAPALPKKRGRR